MISSRYETHNIQTPFLPFIFHRSFTLEKRTINPNWHKNVEILLCVEGEGFVRCDKTVLPLRKNTIVTVNSDVLHTIGTEGKVVYHCLIIDHDFFRSNSIPVDDLLFAPLLKEEKVVEAFRSACEAFACLNPDSFQSVAMLRCEILRFCILLSDHSTQKTLVNRENNYVKDAIIYIRQHLGDPITLEILSHKVGVSPFHLARQFKHYTGNSIIQTVNQMRCVEAQRLLEKGNSVFSVAEACGFSNHSYFSKTFKSIMGRLPSQVRSASLKSD
jgi:AraC-like DNA-binding protein